MRKSVYPIVAKVGQDEIENDSYSKRQMSHARGGGVIAGKDVVQINANW
jgi:hypothetical protein